MITAIVFIKADVARIPEVAEEIAALDGVSEVYSVTGEIDLIAMVRVREHDDVAAWSPTSSTRSRRAATETHIAFRTYSTHDLEAAFSLGAEEWRARHQLPLPPTDRLPRTRSSPRRASTQAESRSLAAPDSTEERAFANPASSWAVTSPASPSYAAIALAALSRTASSTGPGRPATTSRTTCALKSRRPPRRSSVRDGRGRGRAGRGLLVHLAAVDRPDLRRRRRGELVEAVVAAEDEAVDAAPRRARRR